MAASVLLLRHAQSAWNAEGRWQGWADPPLSDEGELAALAVASDPLLDGVAGVVSSDLQRARRTAELLCAGRPWPAVETLRGLRERGAGHWTGLTRDEIGERWPGALVASVAEIPGGETPVAVTARALAVLHRVAERWRGQTVLAVTHGALIRLVEHHAGGDPGPVRNLSGRWVHVGGGRIRLGAPVQLGSVAAGEQAG